MPAARRRASWAQRAATSTPAARKKTAPTAAICQNQSIATPTANARQTARYDLACMEIIEGKVDAAFTKLRKAVGLGLNRVAHAKADADLESLRRDKRWDGLMKLMHDAQGLPPEF